jgi:hypothetical protein
MRSKCVETASSRRQGVRKTACEAATVNVTSNVECRFVRAINTRLAAVDAEDSIANGT